MGGGERVGGGCGVVGYNSRKVFAEFWNDRFDIMMLKLSVAVHSSHGENLIVKCKSVYLHFWQFHWIAFPNNLAWFCVNFRYFLTVKAKGRKLYATNLYYKKVFIHFRAFLEDPLSLCQQSTLVIQSLRTPCMFGWRTWILEASRFASGSSYHSTGNTKTQLW